MRYDKDLDSIVVVIDIASDVGGRRESKRRGQSEWRSDSTCTGSTEDVCFRAIVRRLDDGDDDSVCARTSIGAYRSRSGSSRKLLGRREEGLTSKLPPSSSSSSSSRAAADDDDGDDEEDEDEEDAYACNMRGMLAACQTAPCHVERMLRARTR